MSNPSTLVSQFNGSAAGWTLVAPTRYSNGGLLLEPAATNYLLNPVGATSNTSWTPAANVTVTAISSLPGPLPDWLAGVVTTGFQITATANQTGTLAVPSVATLPGAATYAVLAYVWVPTAFSATGLGHRAINYAGAPVDFVLVDLSKRDQWQLAATYITVGAGDLVGNWSLYINSGTMLSGESVYVTCVAIQSDTPASPATTPVAEVMGTGYANVGTAHNSASTRAASSASVTIAEPAAVACWYREGYSGPKTFAYLEPYGTLGTYGSIAWSGGTLTLSTSRNLVIGPFAAFSRALTANEQANLRSTQNWSMNSVNGSNIILPLSGRRR